MTKTPSPVSSPTRLASSPGLELSPDPFGRKLHRFGSEDHGDDAESIDAFPSPSAVRAAPPVRRSTASSVTSTTSPPRVDSRRHQVTSRFSQDSTTEDDAEKSRSAPRERTNSIISLKGVRNLWRKSGGTPSPLNTVVIRHNGLPLMSPGLNGHTTPQTRFNEEVPPVPSMGSFQQGSGVMPSLPPSKGPEKHHRADSGLDPFHFDQESRYPVRRSPSPVNGYLTDLVPPTSSPMVAVIMPPPTPTTPTSGMKAKSILKGWTSRSKRADSASTSISSPIPIEPSPVTQGKGNTSKKRPSNVDLQGAAHNMSMSEFALSLNTAMPRDPVGLGIGIAEKQGPPAPMLHSPVASEPRESTDTTTRISDFEIVSPAPPGRPRRGTGSRI